MIDFIKEHKNEYPVKTMCEVLDIPRSTYYKSFHKTISKREKENRRLTQRIIEIHNESKKRYGAPKFQYLLNEEVFVVSIHGVQRLRREAGSRSIFVKKYRPTSTKEQLVERKNIWKGDFSPTAVNEKWVGVTTYTCTIKFGGC